MRYTTRRLRTIRRDPGFDDAAASLLGTVERADEALRGVEWGLTREDDFSEYPSLGHTKHGELYAFKTAPMGHDDACIVVFFTVDADELRLHHIVKSTPCCE